MELQSVPLRKIFGSCVFFLALLAVVPPAMAETVDMGCLRDAARDRTNRLRDAQDRLRDDIRGTIERLERDESDALDFNLSLRQQELSRASSNYSVESGNRWRDYSIRTTDAWNEYNKRRSRCYESAVPGSMPPAYTPPNYSNYQNFSGSYPSMQNTYPYYGARGCTPRQLSAPPPGCSYRYGTDSSGCPSYTPVCSNAFSSSSSCTCSSQYSPVCTQDGRTFFNACYAVCLGATVKNQGSCFQY